MDIDTFEFSEFSMFEILYMGHEALTFFVECCIDDATRDPFDIVAEIEAELKSPLAFLTGASHM